MTFRAATAAMVAASLLLLACGDDASTTSTSSSTAQSGSGGSATTGAAGGGTGVGGGMGVGGGGMGGGGGSGAMFTHPVNPVGIGLVGAGNTTQWDRTQELAGPGGHIKLIFAGIEPGMSGAHQEWIDAVNGVYARDLVPVIRLGPPWGDRNIREDADDTSYMSYTSLASAYANVVATLPLREGWPLVIEVHNEPDLCYEWACQPQNAPPHPQTPAGWMHYTSIAAEYAAFLRDVTNAIHALGEWRILVTNGGYAPGGAVTCQCGGDQFTGGITSLDFIDAMEAAVPGVHAALDAFASHPYPASGEGFGFFVPYEQSAVGLYYFESELMQLGLNLPVYITETGWTIDGAANGSRQAVADWTVQAFANDWSTHPAIVSVMPFMLQDPAWDAFGWLDNGNNPYPVFNAVRDWRCNNAIPEPCN